MQSLFDIFPIRIRAGENVWFVIDSVEDAIDFTSSRLCEPNAMGWEKLHANLVKAVQQHDRWRIAGCLQSLRKLADGRARALH